MIYLVICAGVVVGLILTRMIAALHFFGSYFARKQRNQGKDPQEVLRESFPAWIYYLVFWGAPL